MEANRFRFRAWQYQKQKMSEPFTPFLSSGSEYSKKFHDTAGMTGIRTTKLMQSTGLLDRNGQEIFEGDIVVVDENRSTNVLCPTLTRGVVIWDSGAQRVKINNVTLHHYVHAWAWAMTVLGNLYENPELAVAEARLIRL